MGFEYSITLPNAAAEIPRLSMVKSGDYLNMIGYTIRL